jgi:hypothetical protein
VTMILMFFPPAALQMQLAGSGALSENSAQSHCIFHCRVCVLDSWHVKHSTVQVQSGLLCLYLRRDAQLKQITSMFYWISSPGPPLMQVEGSFVRFCKMSGGAWRFVMHANCDCSMYHWD